MKKNITLLSLLLSLLVCSVFVSCSKDDDVDENQSTITNPLVGTWVADDNKTVITFKADFSCSRGKYDSGHTTINYIDTGVYEIDGHKLSIWWESESKYWDEDGPWTTTFTINGNTMNTSEGNGVSWTKQ